MLPPQKSTEMYINAECIGQIYIQSVILIWHTDQIYFLLIASSDYRDKKGKKKHCVSPYFNQIFEINCLLSQVNCLIVDWIDNKNKYRLSDKKKGYFPVTTVSYT